MKNLISPGLWDACGGRFTRKEIDSLPNIEKKLLLKYIESLPIYKNITVNEKQYFLTHSGFHADYRITRTDSGKIDIRASVNLAMEKDVRGYLFSNDIHYVSTSIRFDRKIIVGHFPTIFIPGHEKAKIYHSKKYIDIDTGNERREEGGKLSCLRLDDEKEFYI